MIFDLSGKVAIVTGGNGGIGLGLARGLADAGATLAIVGSNEAKSKPRSTILPRAASRRFRLPPMSPTRRRLPAWSSA
jgi:2-dehydro-3-deoxy-D-gluconate 5-dehydrogenase